MSSHPVEPDAQAAEYDQIVGAPRGKRELGPGTVIDRRYKLRREIAQGGGGRVYEAEHLVSGRRVALKLVPPGDGAAGEKRARLLREARALVLAQQPNVVQVLDAGTDQHGLPYLVMELLHGRPLNGILTSRNTLTPAEVIHLGLDLCRTLAHAHSRGVIHRDVKPGNVFVTRDDVGMEQIKLIDFGIARTSDAEPEAARITTVGAILGTPEYVSPEHLMGRSDCDHRSDIYSLGVLLFECLTGGVPFAGTFGEIILRGNTERMPRVRSRNPAVPEALDAVVARALVEDPGNRYPNMTAMAAALRELIPAGPRPEILVGQRPANTSAEDLGRTTAAKEDLDSRRRYPRAPYVTPIRLVMSDNTTIDGRSEDISEGGVLALMPRPCESEVPVQLRFALPMTDRVISASARPRWGRSGRVGVAVGLEFVDLPDEHRAIIRTYVALMRGE